VPGAWGLQVSGRRGSGSRFTGPVAQRIPTECVRRVRTTGAFAPAHRARAESSGLLTHKMLLGRKCPCWAFREVPGDEQMESRDRLDAARDADRFLQDLEVLKHSDPAEYDRLSRRLKDALSV